MSDLNQIEPKEIWANFQALNAVPRPSKKEEKVRPFIVEFCENLGLKTKVDHVGNVIAKKMAYPGYEDKKTVVLQSHLDMVCQKNNDTIFDFETQGIQMYVTEDGFVKAKGTTLGADNGIGVAAIMSILASKNIPHPPIEALFTIDEETGMTGALGLQGGELNGKILLNLDTEEDTEFDIGCAGGIDVTAHKKIEYVPSDANVSFFKIEIKGLKGGHSGMEIHKGLGNANKILGRILAEIKDFDFLVASVYGGGLRNAIPREAEVVVASTQKNEILEKLKLVFSDIKEEFKTIESGLTLNVSDAESVENVFSKADTNAVIYGLQLAYNGVFRMSPDVEDLVETSNNVARIEVKDDTLRILCLTRSSVESGKLYLAKTLQNTFELVGFEVDFSGSYPGWKANPNSEILALMQDVYTEKFGAAPHVVACHAGLECGILGTNYPEMEMISFGPNIFGAHSPDERVEIKSVQKFWELLKATLERIPVDGFVDYSCSIPLQGK